MEILYIYFDGVIWVTCGVKIFNIYWKWLGEDYKFF